MPNDPAPSTQLQTDVATFHETGESLKVMDKRESDAREVLARIIGQYISAADWAYKLHYEAADRIVDLQRTLRPAADLDAVREACAKAAEKAAVQQEEEGEGGGREWATAKSIAAAIRSLDLSALSCAGEGE